jgi:uncharacterized protein (TIGR02996 family)
MDTELIIQCCKERDRESLLVHLLDVWRTRPLTDIGDVVVLLSESSRSGEPLSEIEDALLTNVYAEKNPLDVVRVLDHLTAGKIKDYCEVLDQLADWPADPRVDRKLVSLVEELPFHSTGSQKMWRRLFKKLKTSRDQTVAERLQASVPQFEERVANTMPKWLTEAVGKLVSRMENPFDPPALSVDEVAALTQIRNEFSSQAPGSKLSEQLLDRILENPDDDEARDVYADMLMEVGDPLGEFIALQMSRYRGVENSNVLKRERQLLKEHWRTFLGPLAKVVYRDGNEFKRGFLAKCTSRANRWKETIGSPYWATVEEFEGPAEIGTHSVMKSQRIFRCRSESLNLVSYCETEQMQRLEFLGTPCLSHADARSLAIPRGNLRGLRVTGDSVPLASPAIGLELTCRGDSSNRSILVACFGWCRPQCAHNGSAKRSRRVRFGMH